MMEEESLRFPWEDDAAASGAPVQPPPPADLDGGAESPSGGVTSDPAAATLEPPATPADEAPQPREPADAAPQPRQAAEPAPQQRRPDARPVVRKEYYSISEVADLVGLPAHVLRYWESQFSVLNPSKNRSGNRVYQRKEIKLILLVKQLLHDEKYTVEGAKQKLEQLRRGGGLPGATGQALDQQLVHVLRDELQQVSELLTVEGD